MYSTVPKVLHELFGKPILEYVIEAAELAGASRIVVVAGRVIEQIKRKYRSRIQVVEQKERLGTAHALVQARRYFSKGGDLLVLAGDAPLIPHLALKSLIRKHQKQKTAASVLTGHVTNPQGYGRVLRDSHGSVTAICEEAEASAEQKKICEINSGTYVFDAVKLKKQLVRVSPSRRKKEFYLTDVIEMMSMAGEKVSGFTLVSEEDITGINTRLTLSQVFKIMQKRNCEKWMARGVTIYDPETVYIAPGAQLGKDVILYPNTYIESDVVIAKDCHIGPFAKIRSGSRIGAGSQIGSFVEVNRTQLGKNTMVKHLSYLGDAEVGDDVNVGAGFVTANFDGKKKHQTKIASGVFLGSNAVLVAPAKIGARARVGAGCVVTAGRTVSAGETVVGVPAKTIKR